MRSSYIERSAVEQLVARVKASGQAELGAKMDEMNAYLANQARARDSLDRQREVNDAEIRRRYERAKENLHVTFIIIKK